MCVCVMYQRSAGVYVCVCVFVCAHTYTCKRARNRQVIRIRGNVLCVCGAYDGVIILSFHLLALLASVGARIKIIY